MKGHNPVVICNGVTKLTLSWLMSSAASHIYCTSPAGPIFSSFSCCTGHKFMFRRGGIEKPSPRRFLVFSLISNSGLRWPLQLCNLHSQRRASHIRPWNWAQGKRYFTYCCCWITLSKIPTLQGLRRTRLDFDYTDLIWPTMHFVFWMYYTSPNYK